MLLSFTILVYGHWGEWGGWSECSKTCETGKRIRVRACNNPVHKNYCIFDGVGNTETTNCKNKPCKGKKHLAIAEMLTTTSILKF